MQKERETRGLSAAVRVTVLLTLLRFRPATMSAADIPGRSICGSSQSQRTLEGRVNLAY